MLRLFPPPDDARRPLSAADAYGDLRLAERAPEGRPYVIANMIATADGQARIGANTAELGNAADRELFATLREQVDCVLAGTRTIELDDYKGPAARPATRDARAARGLRPRPLLATISRGGELPLRAPAFADAELEIVVFGSEAVPAGVRAQVSAAPVHEPRAVLGALRSRFGVHSVLLEGGPHLNAAFFAAELVDELFLTLAPVLAGASDPLAIVAGELPRRQRLRLAGLLLDEDHLFCRYRVD